MPKQKKVDRDQLQFFSLEQSISADSIVRVIDFFCKCIDYEALGFIVKGKSHEGQPAFEASVLTSIYIYGYLHKIRSCRDLEKSCQVNVEMWWLTGMQRPCYKTIANFRKDNSKAFKNLFKTFRKFCMELELYGKTTVAIDGSTFRAQNSKKKNHNLDKVNRQLDYIAKQKEDYLNSLESGDMEEAKLSKLEQRKLKYENLKKKLTTSGESQVSTTDPDSRKMKKNTGGMAICYNIQSSVDDKHNLIVDFDVTNKSDLKALGSMVRKSRKAFEFSDDTKFTALADAGYYFGEQIAQCHLQNTETLVSPRRHGSTKKAGLVSKADFKYDEENNIYTCPQGAKLSSNGIVYEAKDRSPFTKHKILWSTCEQCPLNKACLTKTELNNKKGKTIQRSIYQSSLDKNDLAIKAKKEAYRKRQAIVEHPFGIIKRQWGFNYTLLKGVEKVTGEFSIIMLCYNLRRVINILGIEGLKKALLTLKNNFLVTRCILSTVVRKVFQIDSKLHGASHI